MRQSYLPTSLVLLPTLTSVAPYFSSLACPSTHPSTQCCTYTNLDDFSCVGLALRRCNLMCGEFVKCCISGSTNCVELKQNSRAKFKRQNAEDDRDNLPPPVPTKADEPGAQVPTEVQSKDKGNTSVVSEHEDLEITEPEITEPEITGSETEEDEVLESVSTDDPKPTQEPKSSTNLTSPDSTSSPDPNTPLSPGIPT